MSLRAGETAMSLRSEILPALCVMLCSAFWLSWLAAGSPQTAKLSNKALDACSLLTSTDIAAILGEPLHEIKPSTQATGNMNMSQCVFVTQNFAKSASLAVATPGAEDSGAHNLRAFWRNQFHSPRKQEEERRPSSTNTPAQSAFTSPPEAPEPRAVPSYETTRHAGS